MLLIIWTNGGKRKHKYLNMTLNLNTEMSQVLTNF